MGKVEEFVKRVEWEGLASAYGMVLEDPTVPESGNAEEDGFPYWIDSLRGIEGADGAMVSTIGRSSSYGHYKDIPAPEAEGALLFQAIGLAGGEQHIELAWHLEQTPLTADELAEAGEDLCISKDNRYAYVLTSLMGGVWLLPELAYTDEPDEAAVDELLAMARQLAMSSRAFFWYSEFGNDEGKGWDAAAAIWRARVLASAAVEIS